MKIISKSPVFAIFAGIFLLFTNCSSDTKNDENATGQSQQIAKTTALQAADTVPAYGIGPVESVTLDTEIDQALAKTGKSLFEIKCIACHNFEHRMIGPALNGITEKRNPAWIINMIINPQEMTKKDPIAKSLLAEYNTQMVNMNVNEKDARAILEYFRLMDSEHRPTE